MTEKGSADKDKQSEDTLQPAIVDAAPDREKRKISDEETMGFLREMQENAGQVSELAAEEENLVKQFFGSMLDILKPFSRTLEISISALPESYNGRVGKAYLYITGQLILVYRNGETEICNLADKENHELLVEIIGEIMAQMKSIITSYRSKTEKRVKFLMSITKDLQKIAEALSER